MLRVPDVHQMATFTPVREEKTERKGERENRGRTDLEGEIVTETET